MIKIKPSPTADTRSVEDPSKVTAGQLLESSIMHIEDVRKGLRFFESLLERAAVVHDYDKIYDLQTFHRDFITGFKNTEWWDNHRALNRHHLNAKDGVPKDVNLIDILDMIADCVMAGVARSGHAGFYYPELDKNLLDLAFRNTVELLKKQVVVE